MARRRDHSGRVRQVVRGIATDVVPIHQTIRKSRLTYIEINYIIRNNTRYHKGGGVLLTVKEAADRAGVHIETVRVWIREGRLAAALPARKKGYQINEHDLEAFLSDRSQVKQRGQVAADEVLRSLARAWSATGDKNYTKIAYEVAEISDLLQEYQKKWDQWEGDIVGRENKLLYDRGIHKKYGEIDKLKRVEGELILLSYNESVQNPVRDV